MAKLKITHHEGVPRWFTWLAHHWFVRECRRVGHTYSHWPSCDQCGGYLEKDQ